MRPRKPFPAILRRKLPDPTNTHPLEWMLALLERVRALADHYGLDWRDQSVFDALLKIGPDLCEGFQVTKGKGGAPSRNSRQMSRDIMLLVDIMRAREAGKPDSFAFRKRAKDWGVKPESLRARWHNELTKPKPAALRLIKMVAYLNRDEADEKKL